MWVLRLGSAAVLQPLCSRSPGGVTAGEALGQTVASGLGRCLWAWSFTEEQSFGLSLWQAGFLLFKLCNNSGLNRHR